MKLPHDLMGEIGSCRTQILLIVVVTGLLLGVVLALRHLAGIPIGELVRDPNSVAGVPPYVGLLSQVGILLWSAGAAVCLFCVPFVKGHAESRKWASFLLASGLITLLLDLDDAFQLHEKVLPHFGVPQNLILGSYLVLVLAYLLWFRTLIRETDHALLATALFLFGVSVIVDVFHIRALDGLLEDGAKLVGIVTWLVYLLGVAARAIRDRAAHPESG